MLSKEEKFKALIWKGEQVDLTYGKLVSRYSREEIEKIYLEYENMIRKKQKDAEQKK